MLVLLMSALFYDQQQDTDLGEAFWVIMVSLANIIPVYAVRYFLLNSRPPSFRADEL